MVNIIVSPLQMKQLFVKEAKFIKGTCKITEPNFRFQVVGSKNTPPTHILDLRHLPFLILKLSVDM